MNRIRTKKNKRAIDKLMFLTRRVEKIEIFASETVTTDELNQRFKSFSDIIRSSSIQKRQPESPLLSPFKEPP